MPKIKTHKATAKRFKITKKNKVTKRKTGQDHFNARDNGTTTRKKRGDVVISKTNAKTIKKLMPYN